MNSDVNHPTAISDENDECSTQINITDPFSFTVESESFLNLDFVFHEQCFHKLISVTDFSKYDIILKHNKPVKNFIFLQQKTRNLLLEIGIQNFHGLHISKI